MGSKIDKSTRRAVEAELLRLAEIASGIIDGEDAKLIITERAMHHIANPNPNYRFLTADYFDVDLDEFLRMKKLLMRIERLGKVTVHTALWVRVPDSDEVTLAVQNGVWNRYYTFGMSSMRPPAEMRVALDQGSIITAPMRDEEDHFVAVLAPIRDSLQDVVGVLEVTSSLAEVHPAT